ncbi:hypothetical protein GN244_ATG03119 [Phytophthora infestans]|uniref:Uncharacterized protein n=1 Tax=Phytophthora infestans TaxID=4787 RepID=A0A833TA24_PHYIN|nr:hypothetical protein GN244_ATG03119 [Phytophthora infestans]KAF4134551.1 hypothetical protein GN958_ATG16259 [Phytophthora infestans]
MAHAIWSSALKFARASDGDGPEAGGEEDPPSFAQANSLSPRPSRTLDPPRLERAVISRTRFQITLPTTSPPLGADKTSLASEIDQNGWSSPHGEPYRPLGRPELNLKFSPRLVYGVSHTQQNSHRIHVIEGGGSSNIGVHGAVDSSEKAIEKREASSTSSSGASMVTLVDHFVASLACRKRPPDERQVKLARRLQANMDGFSSDRIRRLYRYKPFVQGLAGDKPQHCHHYLRGDTSLRKLREAIDGGTNRLRSIRNGANFLHCPPSEHRGLHELHEHYLHARTTVPHPLTSCGSSNVRLGTRTSPGMPLGSKTPSDETSMCHTEDDDGQATWYLPYTTRQLQRSPHCHLPSLQGFRVRIREEEEPLKPLRASSNAMAQSFSRRLRVSGAGVRSNRASVSSSRHSMAPNNGPLNTVKGDSCDEMLEPKAPALSKGTPSPFFMTIASPSLTPPASHLHSIEKLQAAVDSLGATKCQQSARLAATLEILAQDRCECLTGKFRSLHVRSDAAEDLKRMREDAERDRDQRMLEVLTKTSVWYSDLIRRLLAREGTPNVNSGVQLTHLHAAELFIVQAVRIFTDNGCEFQSAQLFEVLLYLDHDDLKLPQVQQLLEFLRNALHINYEEWAQFFAGHHLPEPTNKLADDRKDSQGFADGKPCFTTANTARAAVSMDS